MTMISILTIVMMITLSGQASLLLVAGVGRGILILLIIIN